MCPNDTNVLKGQLTFLLHWHRTTLKPSVKMFSQSRNQNTSLGSVFLIYNTIHTWQVSSKRKKCYPSGRNSETNATIIISQSVFSFQYHTRSQHLSVFVVLFTCMWSHGLKTTPASKNIFMDVDWINTFLPYLNKCGYELPNK